MCVNNSHVIDVHMHVGLKGDTMGDLGHFSEEYQQNLVYKIFLLYARIKEEDVTDAHLKEKTIELIDHSGVDKVVCLALDHVYDTRGHPLPSKSHLWVSNRYIVDHLVQELPDRILYGASVHPYDPNFEARLAKCVDEGAVLMKWLPSAQQFDLAQDKVRDAMIAMAAAKPGGNPLPLLLHVGPEYAIHSTDERTRSYDFLSWTFMDEMANFFRFKNKWHKPDEKKIHENLRAAVEAGAVIVFAHCGLPYYFAGILAKIMEHSDFKTVKKYLLHTKNATNTGKCYADISAICTPFRKAYFKKIKKLPPGSLIYGSDIPTPIFELSAGLDENWRDFKAILKGDFSRIAVPQDNLLDVNLSEMKNLFPGHEMFSNFNQYYP